MIHTASTEFTNVNINVMILYIDDDDDDELLSSNIFERNVSPKFRINEIICIISININNGSIICMAKP